MDALLLIFLLPFFYTSSILEKFATMMTTRIADYYYYDGNHMCVSALRLQFLEQIQMEKGKVKFTFGVPSYYLCIPDKKFAFLRFRSLDLLIK